MFPSEVPISCSLCPYNARAILGVSPKGKNEPDQVNGQTSPNSDEFELLGEESLKSDFKHC